MKIRKTKLADLPRIMKIYEHARQFMAEHDNPRQWGNTGWPPEKLIREDISKGDSYVCVDDFDEDQIFGVFYYIFGDHVDPCYQIIEDGDWQLKRPYGVVHRIAADGPKGTGSFMIRWAFDQCGYLRMDTHESNYVMINLLKKLGFKRSGIIYIREDKEPRTAFEWIDE